MLEKISLENSEPIEKIGKRLPLKYIKTDMEKLTPGDFKDEILKPVVIDELKVNEFDDVSIKGKISN